MLKVHILTGVFMLLTAVSLIHSASGRYSPYERKARTACYIPRGDLYKRSRYRLKYGTDVSYLPPGYRVRHNTEIAVFCKRDRRHDAILKTHFRRCRFGRWQPDLPKCKAFKKCRGLEDVAGASVSVSGGRDRAFPHGRVVTYTCDPGAELIGNAERSCNNGQWSAVEFECIDTDLMAMCSNISVVNGDVSVLPDSTPLSFRITCNEGYHQPIGNGVYDCLDDTITYENLTCYPVPCPDIQERFRITDSEINPDLADEMPLVHGVTIQIECDSNTLPYQDIDRATCDSGEWKPMMPVCRGLCRLPRALLRWSNVVYEKTGKAASGRVYHLHRVVQTCKRANRGRRRTATCVNGRWRPGFMRCRPNTRRRNMEYKNCLIPDETFAVYMTAENETLSPFDTLEHDSQITKYCHSDTLAFETEQEQHSCISGDWVPASSPCVVKEPTVHCEIPDIPHVILNTSEELHDVDDIVHVTGCEDDSQFPVGSHELRCLEDGTWVGAVECLQYCENGVEFMAETEYSYVQPLDIQYDYVGTKDDVDSCFSACQYHTDFHCKAIEIIIGRSTDRIYCSLVSTNTLESASSFVQGAVIARRVFDRRCDDRCRVPRLPELVNITNEYGTPLVPRQYVLSGATVHLTCLPVGENDIVSSYMICVGGKWSFMDKLLRCLPDV